MSGGFVVEPHITAAAMRPDPTPSIGNAAPRLAVKSKDPDSADQPEETHGRKHPEIRQFRCVLPVLFERTLQ
jgi:hypothetical protein